MNELSPLDKAKNEVIKQASVMFDVLSKRQVVGMGLGEIRAYADLSEALQVLKREQEALQDALAARGKPATAMPVPQTPGQWVAPSVGMPAPITPDTIDAHRYRKLRKHGVMFKDTIKDEYELIKDFQLDRFTDSVPN